jgi:hypothetical protein
MTYTTAELRFLLDRLTVYSPDFPSHVMWSRVNRKAAGVPTMIFEIRIKALIRLPKPLMFGIC